MKRNPKKRLSLTQKAEKALKEAVQDVIKENKKAGLPLVVWKNGKVVIIPPSEIPTENGSDKNRA